MSWILKRQKTKDYLIGFLSVFVLAYHFIKALTFILLMIQAMLLAHFISGIVTLRCCHLLQWNMKDIFDNESVISDECTRVNKKYRMAIIIGSLFFWAELFCGFVHNAIVFIYTELVKGLALYF